MIRHFKQWWKSQRGATAIEYGLIAGGIAVAIIATVFTIGDTMNGYFETILSYFTP